MHLHGWSPVCISFFKKSELLGQKHITYRLILLCPSRSALWPSAMDHMLDILKQRMHFPFCYVYRSGLSVHVVHVYVCNYVCALRSVWNSLPLPSGRTQKESTIAFGDAAVYCICDSSHSLRAASIYFNLVSGYHEMKFVIATFPGAFYKLIIPPRKTITAKGRRNLFGDISIWAVSVLSCAEKRTD